ncbi:MAG: hypothetical protein JWM93_3966 [Frankiales bacterium]|nr:hypothetical protein [Frankiales bacterium]
MALKRFRAVQYPTHFAVIDHGGPVTDEAGVVVTTADAVGANAGIEVPLYRQDGDPDASETATTVVWRSAGSTSVDCDAALAEADRLNGSEG